MDFYTARATSKNMVVKKNGKITEEYSHQKL